MDESEAILLKTFLEEQARHRAERNRQDEDEKRERREWRDEIKADIKDLRTEISPVVRDHRLIVGIGKWIGGGTAFLYGVVKFWDSVLGHFHR